MALHTTTTGQGQDLVLLHGWAMHSAVWSPVLPQLAQQFRVTCIDLPGHGRSDYDDVDWVEQCLSAAPQQAIWLGWSLGGLLAMLAACRQPERINRLLCVAASPCFSQRQDWQAAMRTDILDGFAQQLRSDWQVTISNFIALQMYGVDDAREHIRELRNLLQAEGSPHMAALTEGLRLLLETDARQCLQSLQLPVNFILGGKDRLVPPGLADVLPSSVQVVELAEAGHAPFISHPRFFLQSLQLMLNSEQGVIA
jgi:pimeloyl-[acyl-carrier protein] methyl ester esterase